MSRGRLSTNQTFFANGDLAQSYNTFLLSADYSWLDPEETLHVKATTAMAVMPGPNSRLFNLNQIWALLMWCRCVRPVSYDFQAIF